MDYESNDNIDNTYNDKIDNKYNDKIDNKYNDQIPNKYNEKMERKRALKFSHNSLRGYYDMGKLGFTFAGFALTPSSLKGLIGSAVSIVVAISTFLAAD